MQFDENLFSHLRFFTLPYKKFSTAPNEKIPLKKPKYIEMKLFS